jgi:two-component system, LytTR family, sensor kinase
VIATAATFAAFNLIGLLLFKYHYLDDVARGHDGTETIRFIEEMTGAYSAMLLVPLVIAITHRFPLDQGRLWRRLPVHLGGLLLFSALDTSLMWGSREIIFRLMGRGSYDYGIMPVRYEMEAANHVIVYAMLVCVITLVDYYQRVRQREQEAAALHRTLAQAQLHALRLRLQPHFLFNALNTISSTMYDDVARADGMIEALGTLLRASLHSTERQEVPLGEEMALLAPYLSIMRARFGDALCVTCDVEPGVERALVPSLVLQPLVENAIRHGNAASIGRAVIVVRARRVGERVALEVHDDGPGADVVEAGVGLSTTRDRLRLLYGEAGTLEAGNDPGGGFAVRVGVPYRIEAR